MIYLASVYSLYATTDSPRDKAIRQLRTDQVMLKTAQLLNDGHCVFSPIVHCHQMSVTCGLPKDHKFWMKLDFEYLLHCDELWVYRMEGWADSKGITMEIEFAKEHSIPIKYID